jgi:hypothetical protein
MRRIFFLVVMFCFSLNLFSNSDSLKYKLEPFTSGFISGNSYKALAVNPGMSLKFKHSTFGLGPLLLFKTNSIIGKNVSSGFNGWAGFYSFTPKYDSHIYMISFCYDIAFETFSERHSFKTPSPVDPYYISKDFYEKVNYVENYLGCKLDYFITPKLRVYQSVGVGIAYSKYSKEGSLYYEHRKSYDPAAIIKIGVSYTL